MLHVSGEDKLGQIYDVPKQIKHSINPMKQSYLGEKEIVSALSLNIEWPDDGKVPGEAPQ
jgi:hypothetical protein